MANTRNNSNNTRATLSADNNHCVLLDKSGNMQGLHVFWRHGQLLSLGTNKGGETSLSCDTNRCLDVYSSPPWSTDIGAGCRTARERRHLVQIRVFAAVVQPRKPTSGGHREPSHDTCCGQYMVAQQQRCHPILHEEQLGVVCICDSSMNTCGVNDIIPCCATGVKMTKIWMTDIPRRRV